MLDNFVVIIKVYCTVVHQCYTDLNPFGRSVGHPWRVLLKPHYHLPPPTSPLPLSIDRSVNACIDQQQARDYIDTQRIESHNNYIFIEPPGSLTTTTSHSLLIDAIFLYPTTSSSFSVGFSSYMYVYLYKSCLSRHNY